MRKGRGNTMSIICLNNHLGDYDNPLQGVKIQDGA